MPKDNAIFIVDWPSWLKLEEFQSALLGVFYPLSDLFSSRLILVNVTKHWVDRVSTLRVFACRVQVRREFIEFDCVCIVFVIHWDS